MSFLGYACLRCGKSLDASYQGYTCPDCGNNLEIRYDFAAVRKALAVADRAERRRMDIFRYAPLLPVQNLALAPPLRIGWTPLYAAERLAKLIGLQELYLKDDGQNPSASFKDRASAIALMRARELGVRVIAGASTGNAGSSMACLAASVGLPCVIFVPEKAPPAKIAQLLVFGAHVLAVQGTYDDAFDLCMKVCAERGWFNRNTGYNPFTREGKKTCALEICEQLGWEPPDRIIVPVGDGNIISGIWKGLRDAREAGLISRFPRVDAAQSDASNAVSRTVWKLREKGSCGDWTSVSVETVKASTVADSISVDQPRDGLAAVRAVIESGGEAVSVPDEEILAAIPELARLAGVFVEPAAACAWAGLKKLVRERRIQPHERVVCLLTGNGLKDIASARRAVGEPIRVPADIRDTLEILTRLGL